MMSCMVGKLLLLQGSISNLTCRIDFDSTQFDLNTRNCRFVHRIAHKKNIFKTIQQSSLRRLWSVDKWYHTRIKQNYEVSKTCAAPPWKIKKHNKFSLVQRSEKGKILLTVCVTPIVPNKHICSYNILFQIFCLYIYSIKRPKLRNILM
jgi:hypothetical protein